jgi:hypothetical protein
MSGAEDLVPHLERISDDQDRWEPVVQNFAKYTISLYRPRTEGQFARIERWEHESGDVHWRATTKENVTSIYGRNPSARIYRWCHQHPPRQRQHMGVDDKSGAFWYVGSGVPGRDAAAA